MFCNLFVKPGAFVLVLVLVLEFGPSGVFEYCALSELHPQTRVGDAEGALDLVPFAGPGIKWLLR